MTHINSIEQHQGVVGGFGEAAVEALGAHTRVEITSGVGDNSSHNDFELEQDLRNYIDVSSNHLLKLKTHVNTFVAINRLPLELLSHIIFFANLPAESAKHPYMLYTWVCRHWRSALIQTPSLWRLVGFELPDDFPINSFVYELVERSKSVTLDIVITLLSYHALSLPKLDHLFARTSNRVRRLWLSSCNSDVAPFLSGRSFPLLQGVSYSGDDYVFFALLSVLVASEHLETIQCTLCTPGPSYGNHGLASIFNRIRNLHLTVSDYEIVQYALGLLHNNVKLLNLHLNIGRRVPSSESTNFPNLIILPELQFLSTNDLSKLEHLRTPKLSSLYACCPTLANNTHSILDEFDFSQTRCLYVVTRKGSSTGPTSIVGFKARSSTEITNLIKYINSSRMENEGEYEYANPAIEDFLSANFPRENSFILKFHSRQILVQALLYLLPRMISLMELYLLLGDQDGSDMNLFHQIASRVPSVEKMVVRYPSPGPLGLICPLTNHTLCPRLNHLSYMAGKGDRNEDNADSIGRLLIKCLQSRHKIYGNKLKYISLEKCPPLADTCVKELQKLGTTVVTPERDLDYPHHLDEIHTA